VVTVGVESLRREPGQDHVGPEAADGQHDVGEDGVVPPDGKGLVRILGVPEVAGPREELLGAVDRAGRQELLRPEEAEPRAELRADEILAAVAAGHREVAGPQEHGVREVGEQPGVLVVRMGGHVQDVADDEQPVEEPLQASRVRLRGPERCGESWGGVQGHGHGEKREGAHWVGRARRRC
jgi:hypothetical protein